MAVSDNYPKQVLQICFCAIINFMLLIYENYKLKIACKKWENVKNWKHDMRKKEAKWPQKRG